VRNSNKKNKTNFMKRLLTAILLLLAGLTSQQSFSQDTTGLGGWAPITRSTQLADYGSQPIHNMREYWRWSDIQPTDSTNYSWTTFDTRMNSLAAANLFIIGMSWSGPDCPPWLKAITGTYHTSDNPSLTFPYYFHPAYKRLLFKYRDSLVRHINTLSAPTKAKFLYLFFCHGTTGDEGPSHGKFTDYNYLGQHSIDEVGPEWTAYRTEVMDSINAKVQRYASWIKPAFNAGQDGRLYAYMRWHVPTAINKDSRLAHYYTFSRQQTYVNRRATFDTRTGQTRTDLISFDEGQDAFYNNTEKHQNIYAHFVAAKASGLDMFHVDLLYMTNLFWAPGESSTPVKYGTWYNNYSGYINEHKKGFIYPHKIPNYLDTVRYNTTVYNPLVSAAQLTAYNNSIHAIDISTDSVEIKDFKKLNTLVSYFYTIRKAKIKEGYPLLRESTTDEYYNDLDFDPLGDWSMNITQVDTAIIMARLSDGISEQGRFYYKMPAIGKIRFDVSDVVKKTSSTDTIRILVNYYDTSNYVWTIGCADCKNKLVRTVTNGNTHLWKTVTVDIPKFKFNNGWDFYIKSSSPILWGEIDVENRSK
jgi:hypothetical protein